MLSRLDFTKLDFARLCFARLYFVRPDFRAIGKNWQSSDGAGEVGAGEVVALEEDGFAGGAGEGVREAVAEVEVGGVAAAPAKVSVGLAGDARLLGGDGLDADAEPVEQIIETATEQGVFPAVDDDVGFNEGAGRDLVDW